MALWHVTVRLPDGDRRSLLRELRRRPGVTIRSVTDRDATVEVAGPDEDHVRAHWADAEVLSVFRVGDGWSGDWWDGQDLETIDSGYQLGPAGDAQDSLLVAVPFHHYAIDDTGRRMTLFWNGWGMCRPGPAILDERTDGIIVTVTERCPRGPLLAVGEGRRSIVELETPLGGRAVWDRQPGVARPLA